jgi:hypothetical protein
MERVFSVEEIPDPYWAQPSPRASGAAANAHPGGEGAMNRSSSEWYFQKFLEDAVLDSPVGENPIPMPGTSGGVIGGEAAEVRNPAVPSLAPAPATSAVVDPVEYNAMLKQQLEKDLAAVAMWRVWSFTLTYGAPLARNVTPSIFRHLDR